jgi:hypothetical protein
MRINARSPERHPPTAKLPGTPYHGRLRLLLAYTTTSRFSFAGEG